MAGHAAECYRIAGEARDVGIRGGAVGPVACGEFAFFAEFRYREWIPERQENIQEGYGRGSLIVAK